MKVPVYEERVSQGSVPNYQVSAQPVDYGQIGAQVWQNMGQAGMQAAKTGLDIDILQANMEAETSVLESSAAMERQLDSLLYDPNPGPDGKPVGLLARKGDDAKGCYDAARDLITKTFDDYRGSLPPGMQQDRFIKLNMNRVMQLDEQARRYDFQQAEERNALARNATMQLKGQNSVNILSTTQPFTEVEREVDGPSIAGLVRQGDKGENVKLVQQALINAGYKLDADGVFGAQTAEALKKFQSGKGLAADGVAGVNTLGALGFNGKRMVKEWVADDSGWFRSINMDYGGALNAELMAKGIDINSDAAHLYRLEKKSAVVAEAVQSAMSAGNFEQAKLVYNWAEKKGLLLPETAAKIGGVIRQIDESNIAEMYGNQYGALLASGKLSYSQLEEELFNVKELVNNPQLRQKIKQGAFSTASRMASEQNRQQAAQMNAVLGYLQKSDIGYDAGVKYILANVQDAEAQRSMLSQWKTFSNATKFTGSSSSNKEVKTALDIRKDKGVLTTTEVDNASASGYLSDADAMKYYAAIANDTKGQQAKLTKAVYDEQYKNLELTNPEKAAVLEAYYKGDALKTADEVNWLVDYLNKHKDPGDIFRSFNPDMKAQFGEAEYDGQVYYYRGMGLNRVDVNSLHHAIISGDRTIPSPNLVKGKAVALGLLSDVYRRAAAWYWSENYVFYQKQFPNLTNKAIDSIVNDSSFADYYKLYEAAVR